MTHCGAHKICSKCAHFLFVCIEKQGFCSERGKGKREREKVFLFFKKNMQNHFGVNILLCNGIVYENEYICVHSVYTDSISLSCALNDDPLDSKLDDSINIT